MSCICVELIMCAISFTIACISSYMKSENDIQGIFEDEYVIWLTELSTQIAEGKNIYPYVLYSCIIMQNSSPKSAKYEFPTHCQSSSPDFHHLQLYNLCLFSFIGASTTMLLSKICNSNVIINMKYKIINIKKKYTFIFH